MRLIRTLAAAAASLLLLTGCSDLTRQQTRDTAALEFRFYPITDQLSDLETDSGLINRLRKDYDTMLLSRSAQFHASLLPNVKEPLNLVPEDPVLPVSRYCPTAQLLLHSEEEAAVNMNPVLVMRQMLAGMKEAAVTEGETAQSSGTETVPAAAEGTYGAPSLFISNCLRKYYCDMDYQVGFSESENLYYVYLFDAREQLCVMAIYFRFDTDGRLGSVGFDSMIYDPYEITLMEDGAFLPLQVPSDPQELTPFRLLKTMAVSMVGAVPESRAVGTSRIGGTVPLAENAALSCRHEHEEQRYYVGAETDDGLIAVRMMDWYIYTQPLQEPATGGQA